MSGTQQEKGRQRAASILQLSCGVLLAFALIDGALGANILSVDAIRTGDRYTVISNTHFDATPDSLFCALLDYDQLSGISDTIKESRYLEAGGNGERLVYTRIRGCVFLFCKTVEKVEHLESTRPNFIQTNAIPERSNVRYSRSEWRLSAASGGGTNVAYKLEFEPDFWVPPFIGAMLIKHALIADGASAVTRIEALANTKAAAACD